MKEYLSESKGFSQSRSLYGSIVVDNIKSAIAIQNQAKDDGRSSKWYINKTIFVSSAFAGLLILIMGVSFSDSDVHIFSHRAHLEKEVESLNSETDEIPFPHVDRSVYNIPANKIIDTSLFHYDLRNDIDEKSSETITDLDTGKPLLKVPLPTGAFWTNLILPEYSGGSDESFPVMVYPYAYSWSSNGLTMAYPSLRRLMDEISIRDIFNPDIHFKTAETISSRYITKFDPLSVTLRFDMKQAGGTTSNLRSEKVSFMETYLVQGSPWSTIRYVNTTPIIHALSIFTSVECGNDFDTSEPQCMIVTDTSTASRSNSIKLKGKRFLIHAEKGLIWLLVSSKEIELTFDTMRKTTVYMTEPFDGVFRFTLLPPKQSNDFPLTEKFPNTYENVDINSSTGYQTLLNTCDLYPIGAKINWEFPSSSDGDKYSIAKLNFQYEVKSMSDENSNDSFDASNLLMMSLPHHTQILKTNHLPNSTEFDLSYRTIKGFMSPVLGDCWYMEETLTNIGLDSDETLLKVQNFDDALREKILKQVQIDSIQVLPKTDENVYGFGKQVARLAQLAHITNTIGATPSSDSLLNDIKVSLHEYLVNYLSGDIKDRLLYDENFGGIVSIDGLKNSQDDYGNGWYNDHHFHYGYILYACGILGTLNSTFISEYGSYVDALMHDVAYNKNSHSSDQEEDVSFLPFTRYKSWYDGHSFASGLFPFADGKSMESSTESINCYYGAYVWLLARENDTNNVDYDEEFNFARLLLATEIRSVRLYWHMRASGDAEGVRGNPSIYNPTFAKNMMVGNTAMMDVTVATWFGTQPLYVHMINFMPVTAVTKELFDESYIKDEFETIIRPLYDEVEVAWKGYTVCDRALSNPMKAWNDAQDLISPELDQALSKSQVFYFIATLSDFNVTEVDINTNHGNEVDSYSCAANPKCHSLGLTGLCCPTEVGGALLSCCDAYETESDTDTKNDASAFASGSNTSA